MLFIDSFVPTCSYAVSVCFFLIISTNKVKLVCQQGCTKTDSIQLELRMGLNPKKTQLTLGVDLDKGTDPGMVRVRVTLQDRKFLFVIFPLKSVPFPSTQTLLTAISMSAIATNGVVPGKLLTLAFIINLFYTL